MKEILTAWQWDGPVSEPVPYGEGHINQTYAITVTSEQGAKRYILQKINTNTFKDPAGLMENVCGIQLKALGLLDSITQGRRLIAETEVIKTYTPSTQNYAEWNAAYDRFKTLL